MHVKFSIQLSMLIIVAIIDGHNYLDD